MWSTQQRGKQNLGCLLVCFFSPVTLTASKHRGHLWPLTPIQSSRRHLWVKRGGSALLIMRLTHASRHCALLPSYNSRKYSDHEWDWWILGDFSTSILGGKLLASCPKLASQSKAELMIERFLFLSSTVLSPSPTLLTINNAQLSCEVI